MVKIRHIGKYELLEEIGHGGFAIVYKARDTVLDREVALKTLYSHYAADPNFAARFRREAREAAKLHHSNVVTIYETGTETGQLYIAMEYLPGRTLRALLEEEGRLSLELVLPILAQLADALDYAHTRGVVHRDIKPANVLVVGFGRMIRAVLTDFGLVKALAASSALTSHGTLLGSPEYMAPEQADPERSLDVGPEADLYALGVIAYQMLTGRVPFPGNTPATLNAHENKPVPPPCELCPDLPKPVAAALLKMLAKAPEDRFPSAVAFVDCLRAEMEMRQHIAKIAPLRAKLGEAAVRGDWATVLELGSRITMLEPEDPAVTMLVQRARERLSKPEFKKVGVAEDDKKRTAQPALVKKSERRWLSKLKALVSPLGWFLVAGTVVGLLGTGLGWWSPMPMFDPIRNPLLALSPSPSSSPFPTFTATHVPTHAPSSTPLPTFTPTPTSVPFVPAAFGTWRRFEDTMVMVRVPAGEFQMGSRDGDSDELPVHTVVLDEFWMDQTEVTNAQYARCVAAGACEPSDYADDANFNGDTYPVVGVSWNDAAAYCAWVGARLPTESEWEYAACGSGGTIYPWGDVFDCSLCNAYDIEHACDGYAMTAPVGSFPEGTSWCGALDLSGNVWEWVADWYKGTYSYGWQKNPTGPTAGDFKVLRGGSWWGFSEWDLRGTLRGVNEPTGRNHNVGFRCVLSQPYYRPWATIF